MVETVVKRCSQVVMGHSVKLKHSIDNCQISKTKIEFVESVNGKYLKQLVGTSETNTKCNSL